MNNRCQHYIVKSVESFPPYKPMSSCHGLAIEIKKLYYQKPLLNLRARKRRLSHRFVRYQVIITRFTDLQIIWTPERNLAFFDLLSGNVSLKDLNSHQLAHKEFPKNIRIIIQIGHEVQYLIYHNTSADDGNGNFYRIVWTHLSETQALQLENKSIDMICTIFDPRSPKAPLRSLIFSEAVRVLF